MRARCCRAAAGDQRHRAHVAAPAAAAERLGGRGRRGAGAAGRRAWRAEACGASCRAASSSTTSATRIDVDAVHAFISTQSYWGLGRARALVVRAIEGSTRVRRAVSRRRLARRRAGRLRARRCPTARASPTSPTCTCCGAHRGRGLGLELVREMVERSFDGVRWMLHTADAQPLYAKLGFVEGQPPYPLMERPPGARHRARDDPPLAFPAREHQPDQRAADRLLRGRPGLRAPRAAAVLRRPGHERDAQVDPGRVRRRGRLPDRQPRPAGRGLRGDRRQGAAPRRAGVPRGRRARAVRRASTSCRRSRPTRCTAAATRCSRRSGGR